MNTKPNLLFSSKLCSMSFGSFKNSIGCASSMPKAGWFVRKLEDKNRFQTASRVVGRKAEGTLSSAI